MIPLARGPLERILEALIQKNLDYDRQAEEIRKAWSKFLWIDWTKFLIKLITLITSALFHQSLRCS